MDMLEGEVNNVSYDCDRRLTGQGELLPANERKPDHAQTETLEGTLI